MSPDIAPKLTAYSSSQPTTPAGGPQRRPGMGPRGRKKSDYGHQLAEKQKARKEYNLREAQFRNYFKRSLKSSVETGQALFTALERRLDNVVYRSGLAKTRRMGRQMVTHGHIEVNNRRLTIPSYQLKPKDYVALRASANFEYNPDAVVPNWLSVSIEKSSATVDRLPKADDLASDLNTQLIIEYYSR